MFALTNKIEVYVTLDTVNKYSAILQSIWVSGRGAQKELDEAKLRFAAAEVPFYFLWPFNPFFFFPLRDELYPC